MKPFDPIILASRLGKRQREVVQSLSVEWSKSPNHECAKRLWVGPHYIVEHKHKTGNCWRLNDRGVSVKMALFLGLDRSA